MTNKENVRGAGGPARMKIDPFHVCGLLATIGCVVVVVMILFWDPNLWGSRDHAEHRGMFESWGKPRNDWIALGASWVLAALCVLIPAVLLFLGLGTRRSSPRWPGLLAGSILQLVILGAVLLTWACGCWSDRIVLGFPLATSLVLFGFWPAPLCWLLSYLGEEKRRGK